MLNLEFGVRTCMNSIVHKDYIYVSFVPTVSLQPNLLAYLKSFIHLSPNKLNHVICNFHVDLKTIFM